MKKRLDSFINSSIILSIILIMLGLFAVFMPNITLRSFSMFVSIYLMIHGIFLMVLNIRSRNLFFPIDTLVPGVLSLVLGIVLLIYPNTLNVIIPIVVGIFIILHSINYLCMVINFRKCLSIGNFIVSLLLVIFEFILGLIVLLNPMISAITMTMFVGSIMVIYSILNIIDMFIFKRNIRKRSKEFKEVIDEINHL